MNLKSLAVLKGINSHVSRPYREFFKSVLQFRLTTGYRVCALLSCLVSLQQGCGRRNCSNSLARFLNLWLYASVPSVYTSD
ncbi:hypothetical protein L3X38_017069 [Prunus dulcis]|uniref:Uncharacterized protein n=1 Tax=Prunus dulcis TaxID=3755 RepID=A0AAD4W7F7_PRUDU|nr:hypothetical protein L3X38_017069 [Prunus dulcis]